MVKKKYVIYWEGETEQSEKGQHYTILGLICLVAFNF